MCLCVEKANSKKTLSETKEDAIIAQLKAKVDTDKVLLAKLKSQLGL